VHAGSSVEVDPDADRDAYRDTDREADRDADRDVDLDGDRGRRGQDEAEGDGADVLDIDDIGDLDTGEREPAAAGTRREPGDASQPLVTGAMARPAGQVEPGPDATLLSRRDSYRQRWDTIQAGFVDEPGYAVESAGNLLTDILDDLAASLAAKRDQVESPWRQGDGGSTEEARDLFRAYRSYFERLVTL
jgi:hypothetical protein